MKISGIDPEELPSLAAQAVKANRKLVEKLETDRPEQLDEWVHEAHRRQFSGIDCLDCANCCKSTPALVEQEDMERIASHLGLSVSEFLTTYLEMDEDGDFVTKQTPCIFLDGDNACRIYEVRPNACREYPLTLRRDQVEILDISLTNTAICPAVFRIFQKLRSLVQEAS